MNKFIRFAHSLLKLNEIGSFEAVKLDNDSARIKCYAINRDSVIAYEDWATQDEAIARIDFLEALFNYIDEEEVEKKKTHILFGDSLVAISRLDYFKIEKRDAINGYIIKQNISFDLEYYNTHEEALRRLHQLEEILNV